jgi:hypothetical protein
MHKLAAVEEAKALMNEAKDWGVWHWLTEKARVRAAADQANDALGELEKQVKAGWDDDLKQAWHGMQKRASKNGKPHHLDPETELALERVKEMDEEAERARLDAEATFDEAERRMSASMACDGAQKAIDAWVLREKAIRRAEAVGKKK